MKWFQLLTNSVDALTQRIVFVQTKKLNIKAEISVTDKGNAIHQSIADKIFQLCFTTKSTGQGTGLAYDIIKAYGCEIKVLTREGAAFTI